MSNASTFSKIINALRGVSNKKLLINKSLLRDRNRKIKLDAVKRLPTTKRLIFEQIVKCLRWY